MPHSNPFYKRRIGHYSFRPNFRLLRGIPHWASEGINLH